MRIPPLFVGLSLAANLGLAFALITQSKSPSPTASGEARHDANAAVAAIDPRANAASTNATADALSPQVVQALPDMFRQLIDGDFVAGVARLRAAGMADETVDLIAQAVVMQKFRKAYEDMGPGAFMWGGGYVRTEAQREQQRKLQEFQRKMTEDARKAGVGQNFFAMARGKLPGLAADKAEQLARLEADHQELRSQVHMEASGMMLDRDSERLKYIDQEFKKDLGALLSPEELDAWRLTQSESAQTLRAQLAYMAPSDDEFRKILKLQAAFDEAWPASYGGNTDWQMRSNAEREMKKQIAELLGPARAADYEKSTDYEFGTLSNIEYRLELPKGSAERVYTLHREAEQTARKIRSDHALTDEDRKESLKVLDEQVRSELSAVLGAEGLKAYRGQHGHWIDGLKQ